MKRNVKTLILLLFVVSMTYFVKPYNLNGEINEGFKGGKGKRGSRGGRGKRGRRGEEEKEEEGEVVITDMETFIEEVVTADIHMADMADMEDMADMVDMVDMVDIRIHITHHMMRYHLLIHGGVRMDTQILPIGLILEIAQLDVLQIQQALVDFHVLVIIVGFHAKQMLIVMDVMYHW